MNRFWETVISPLLEAVDPETVVEIGSDHGDNTRKLLRFCRERGARLHVIDPLPKYDVPALQEEHGEALVFHEALSLEALPETGCADVVLIDGDHNWYTVLGELQLIERRCGELSRPYPLVLLHDVGWPYGRRDLYYDPGTVPEAYRHPQSQEGLRSGTSEVNGEEGLNAHLHNALRENTPRNGVLTAAEDFVSETGLDIELLGLPGLSGLGLLAPRPLRERNSELAGILEELRLSQPVRRHVEQVEEERLNALVALQEQSLKRRDLRSQLKAARERLDATQETLKQERKDLRRLRAVNEELNQDKEQLNQDKEQLNQDKEQLSGWLERLDTDVTALLGSRKWRVVDGVARLQRKVLLRPRVPVVEEPIRGTLERFRAWRERSGEQ